MTDDEAVRAFLDLLAKLAEVAGLPATGDVVGGRVEGRLVRDGNGSPPGSREALDLHLEIRLAGDGS